MNCPSPSAALRVGLAVGEPGRGEDRGAVEVERVDLVVVEGGDDLELGSSSMFPMPTFSPYAP
jgi:hypothetical protein